MFLENTVGTFGPARQFLKNLSYCLTCLVSSQRLFNKRFVDNQHETYALVILYSLDTLS